MSQMNHPQMVATTPIIDEDAVAAADKEMEERANRAKELLSQRHKGLRVQQVRALCVRCIRSLSVLPWLVRITSYLSIFLFTGG
jgi:hypothetical protein